MTEVHALVKDIMTADVAAVRSDAPYQEMTALLRALAGLSARADLVVLGRRSAHHGPGSVMHAVLSHAHGLLVTVPS